MPPEDKLV